MIFRVLSYPGFGPQWRATPDKPAVFYCTAPTAEDAKYLVQITTAQHCFETWQCFGCDQVEKKDVPKGAHTLDWSDYLREKGDDENHRIVVAADAPVDEKDSRAAADHVCLTKITSDIKRSLAGGGQDITGL